MTTSTHGARPGPGTAAPPRISTALGAATALTALSLVVSAYLHLHLAANYAPNRTAGTISEGEIFHLQAAASVAVAAALLITVALGRAWLGATLLTAAGLLAGSLAAVLTYRYHDIGKILFLPDMYEPTWFRDKTLSAIIEGAGALAALGGARTARQRTR
jgi:hypothetical protein